jgi:hypothetical protein
VARRRTLRHRNRDWPSGVSTVGICFTSAPSRCADSITCKVIILLLSIHFLVFSASLSRDSKVCALSACDCCCSCWTRDGLRVGSFTLLHFNATIHPHL